MMKLALIAAAALALGGAAPSGDLVGDLDSGAGDLSGRHAFEGPFAALCLAGLELALGGESGPVRIGLTGTAGRCGCPDGCSLASLHLNVAGLRVVV